MMIIIMVILCCYDAIIQSKIARFLRLSLSWLLLNYHHYHYIIPQAHLAHYKHRVTMMMIQTSIAIMTIMIMIGCLDPVVFINFGDILVQLDFFFLPIPLEK